MLSTDRKKLLRCFIALVVVAFFITVKCHADSGDDPGGWGDDTSPGGDIPIPGIIYFLLAMAGIGIRKIYHGRKHN
jgi:hypothetical protein